MRLTVNSVGLLVGEALLARVDMNGHFRGLIDGCLCQASLYGLVKFRPTSLQGGCLQSTFSFFPKAA
jgi:hypothetical protein